MIGIIWAGKQRCKARRADANGFSHTHFRKKWVRDVVAYKLPTKLPTRGNANGFSHTHFVRSGCVMLLPTKGTPTAFRIPTS